MLKYQTQTTNRTVTTIRSSLILRANSDTEDVPLAQLLGESSSTSATNDEDDDVPLAQVAKQSQ